jgi:hypothetical protein
MLNARTDDFVIEDRSQLIYALTEAVALEHVLMCQYLFAAASLKTHLSELDDSDRKYFQLERIRYWKRKLTEVAREEMQHLAMAMNLLVAVGGAPTFERPNFPNENLYYKDRLPDGTYRGLLMSLDNFSGRGASPFSVIDRFIRFESPQKPVPGTRLLEGIPPANMYDTVGQLYRAIKDAFGRIPNVLVDVSDQYDPHDEGNESVRLRYRPPVKVIVTTPTEAQDVIDQIINQGEGYTPKSVDLRSHYEIFQRVRKEFENELSMCPSFAPARDVVSNPATRMHEGVITKLVTVIDKGIDGGLQYNLLQLFAGAYEVLIGWLGQLFSGNTRQSKPPKLRALETLTFLPFMSEVISPLAELITHVPAKLGEPQRRLGPSFEVTSNDFLLPSLEISTELTNERLLELVDLSKSLVDPLRAAGIGKAASELAFVSKTLELTLDEIRSRAVYGWPPAVDRWDYTYSETVPQDFEFDFGNQSVLELQFEGIFQCRLATDPDGANVVRGVTGNGFAIGDEPDLNRVIYFQAPEASQRSHCPPIGVKVHAARLLRASSLPWRDRGELIPQLRGALVDLKENPKFEGRNHVVSEDGEPIDPFVIEVRTGTGIRLVRRAIGIPMNDMTPLQRRGSGRYPPIGAQLSAEAMAANLAVLSRLDEPFKFDTPLEYTLDRISKLKKDWDTIAGTNQQYSKLGAELEFRLRSLDEGLRPAMDLDARTIRWTRYFFDCGYRHFVSGEMMGDFGPLSTRFELVSQSKSPTASRWLVDYHLGFFDTDAMSACVSGKLYIPVKDKKT